MSDLALRCACGTVLGIARKMEPHAGNDVICHCRRAGSAADGRVLILRP